MSATDEEQAPAKVAARLSALMQEYTKKIRDISEHVREIQDRYARANSPGEARPVNGPKDIRVLARAQLDFKAVRFTYLRLATPATDLARQASQMVENGKMDIADRLEMSLRLGEFEAALQEAQQRVNAGLAS